MPTQLSVALHLTHQCNLRCEYCYTGEKLNLPMSTEVMEATLDLCFSELKRRGATHFDVTFFGGEPLIELNLLLRAADRLIAETTDEVTLNLKMSTNGTLLTEAILRKLMARNIYISLSIDGAPDIQDRQRPNAAGKGSSLAVERAAKMLLAANPCANVTCVLQPTSAAYAAESIDYLFELGFRYFNLTLDYSGSWTMDDLKRLEKSYRRLAKWYEQKMLAGTNFYLSCFDERIKGHAQGVESEEERCSLGGRQFSVAPDGAIYPCLQFVTTEGVPEFMIGHVLHGGIYEDTRQHINSCATAPKEECSGCAIQSRCGSWCACINYASTGTVTAASPVLCQYEQRVLPLVDKLAARLYRRRNRKFLHKHYDPDYPLMDYLEQLARLEENNYVKLENVKS